jgi:lysyl-tRNA synthetase class I
MKINKEYEIDMDVDDDNVKPNSVEIEFDVRYTAGHIYQEKWLQSNLYCPACGKQEVFIENAPGDYYQGVSYNCSCCGAEFSMSLTRELDNESAQRLEYFKEFKEKSKE